jgi:hypothetical protein
MKEIDLAGLELKAGKLLTGRVLWGLGLTGAAVLLTLPASRRALRKVLVSSLATGMVARDQVQKMGEEWQGIVAEARDLHEIDAEVEAAPQSTPS